MDTDDFEYREIRHKIQEDILLLNYRTFLEKYINDTDNHLYILESLANFIKLDFFIKFIEHTKFKPNYSNNYFFTLFVKKANTEIFLCQILEYFVIQSGLSINFDNGSIIYNLSTKYFFPILIEYGYDLKLRPNFFFDFYRKKDNEYIKIFLDHGVILDDKLKHYINLLLANENIEAIDLLIDYGIDISKNIGFYLFNCLIKKKIMSLKYLLAKGYHLEDIFSDPECNLKPNNKCSEILDIIKSSNLTMEQIYFIFYSRDELFHFDKIMFENID